MAKAQEKKSIGTKFFLFLAQAQTLAWACPQGKMLRCGAEVHKFSLQDLPQIPKQYRCNALLMANINLEMTVLRIGLFSLPKLMRMSPQGAATITSFHYLQKRDNSSASHLHQEQSHEYQETVFRVN